MYLDVIAISSCGYRKWLLDEKVKVYLTNFFLR